MESITQVVRPKRMRNGKELNLQWKDLKQFISNLTKEQLEQEVRFWGDEKAGGFFSISILEEDFINPTGLGAEPISTYEHDEDEPIIYRKGTILLDVNE